MKNHLIILGLLLSTTYLCAQEAKKESKSASVPITIQWVDHLPGDFSFRKIWDYPEGIYKNDYGQVTCDGFCLPETYAMKDSSGRIYEDSLGAFYKIMDTTHQFHSIQCEAWCYEWAGTDYVKAWRMGKDSFYCHTMCNAGTHCGLDLHITRNVCYATIDLISEVPNGDAIFYCTDGYIVIDKKLWKKGIMKAKFSLSFNHWENPSQPMFWKGRVYTEIRNPE